jgi:tRNA (mo5U34)-methyltransferase
MQVYHLASIRDRFDLVLFLGVLYHLRYPQLALDLVAQRVGGRLIFQTMTMPGSQPLETPADIGINERTRLTGPGWPRAAFIEHALEGDTTNWWVPDDACARAMLRSAGLRITDLLGPEIYACAPEAGRDPARALRLAELAAVFGAPSVV